VNHLTSGRRNIGKAQHEVEVMQMLFWTIGIVIAIGLIWSIVAMSNLVPVTS